VKGRKPGMLARDGGQAIGWVAVAPREGHGQLVRTRVYRPHARGDMGVPSTFERLGFSAVRRAGPRTIVRLSA
jgi:hypothetical protein